MGVEIHDKNEILFSHSNQGTKDVSSWGGKKVSKKAVDGESSKKSKSIFGKMKDYMKAAWNHKYKILLGALGVVALGATATGLSMLIAKKVNSKALPEIKQEPDSKNAVEDDKPSGAKEVSEVEEIKEEEKTTSPQLVHLTLGRPVRKGIRPPTLHKTGEKPVDKQDEVREESVEKVSPQQTEAEKPDVIVEHESEPTKFQDEKIEDIKEQVVEEKAKHVDLESPLANSEMVKCEAEETEDVQDEVSEEPVVKQDAEEEAKLPDVFCTVDDSELEKVELLEEPVVKQDAEEEAELLDLLCTIYDSEPEKVEVASEPVTKQEPTPVRAPVAPTIRQIKTKRQQIKLQRELNRKLNKLERKQQLHPKKQAKCSRKISKLLHKLAAAK